MKIVVPLLIVLLTVIIIFNINSNRTKTDDRDLLYKAVISNDYGKTMKLLENGTDSDYIVDDKSMLMYAIDNNNIEIIKTLLFYNASLEVNIPDHDYSGENIVNICEYCVEYGNLECFKVLTENNLIDVTHLLFTAVIYNNVDIADYLIKRGADVNAIHIFGQHKGVVFFVKSVRMADLLYKNKVKINVKDNDGNTPLHEAGNSDMVKWFVSHGINPNAKNLNKQTPLHNFAQMGNADLIITVIKNGGNKNSIDISGKKPVDYAKDNKIRELL